MDSGIVITNYTDMDTLTENLFDFFFMLNGDRECTLEITEKQNINFQKDINKIMSLFESSTDESIKIINNYTSPEGVKIKLKIKTND